MKEKFFDEFCTAFVSKGMQKLMDSSDCTAEECFEAIAGLAHEGDRTSQTILALILRADGKPQIVWDIWLTRSLSPHEADDSMLVYALYKYCKSDSGDSEDACFGDQSFVMAALYAFKCVNAEIEYADILQSTMIFDFTKHYNNNKDRFSNLQVDRTGSADDVAKRIYFCLVENVIKTHDGLSGLDEESSNCSSNIVEPPASSAYKDLAKSVNANGDDKFYSVPYISSEKISNFLVKTGYRTNKDDVIFYYDDTVFGKGDVGVLVDSNNIVINEQYADVKIIPLSTVIGIEISGFIGRKIVLISSNGLKQSMSLTQSNKGAKLFHDALLKLISLKDCHGQSNP